MPRKLSRPKTLATAAHPPIVMPPPQPEFCGCGARGAHFGIGQAWMCLACWQNHPTNRDARDAALDQIRALAEIEDDAA